MALSEVQLIFSLQPHQPMYHTLRGNVNNWSQFQFPSVAVSSVDYGGKFKSLLLISPEWSTFPFINVEKDKANCDASPDRIPLFIRSKMSLQKCFFQPQPQLPWSASSHVFASPSSTCSLHQMSIKCPLMNQSNQANPHLRQDPVPEIQSHQFPAHCMEA